MGKIYRRPKHSPQKLSNGEWATSNHVPVHGRTDKDAVIRQYHRENMFKDRPRTRVKYKDSSGNTHEVKDAISNVSPEGEYYVQSVLGFAPKNVDLESLGGDNTYTKLLHYFLKNTQLPMDDIMRNHEYANLADMLKDNDTYADTIDQISDIFGGFDKSRIPDDDEFKSLAILGKLANDAVKARNPDDSFGPMEDLINYYTQLSSSEADKRPELPSSSGDHYEVRRRKMKAKPVLDDLGGFLRWADPDPSTDEMLGEPGLSGDESRDFRILNDDLSLADIANYAQTGVEGLDPEDVVPLTNIIPSMPSDLKKTAFRNYTTGRALEALREAAENYDVLNEDAYNTLNEDILDTKSRMIPGDFIYENGLRRIVKDLTNQANAPEYLGGGLGSLISRIAGNRSLARGAGSPKNPVNFLTGSLEDLEDYVTQALGIKPSEQKINNLLKPSDLTGYPLWNKDLQGSFINNLKNRVKRSITKDIDSNEESGNVSKPKFNKNAQRDLRKAARLLMNDSNIVGDKGWQDNVRKALSWGADIDKLEFDDASLGDNIRSLLKGFDNGERAEDTSSKPRGWHKWDIPEEIGSKPSSALDALRTFIKNAVDQSKTEGMTEGHSNNLDVLDTLADSVDLDNPFASLHNLLNKNMPESFIDRDLDDDTLQLVNQWQSELLPPKRLVAPDISDILKGKYTDEKELDEALKQYAGYLEKSRLDRARQSAGKHGSSVDEVMAGMPVMDQYTLDNFREAAKEAKEKRNSRDAKKSERLKKLEENANAKMTEKDRDDTMSKLVDLGEDVTGENIDLFKLMSNPREGNRLGMVKKVDHYGVPEYRKLTSFTGPANDRMAVWTKLDDVHDIIPDIENIWESSDMSEDEKTALLRKLGEDDWNMLDLGALKDAAQKRLANQRANRDQRLEQAISEKREKDEAERAEKEKKQADFESLSKSLAKDEKLRNSRLLKAEYDRAQKKRDALEGTEEGTKKQNEATYNLLKGGTGGPLAAEGTGKVLSNVGEKEAPKMNEERLYHNSVVQTELNKADKESTKPVGSRMSDASLAAANDARKQKVEAERAKDNQLKQEWDVYNAVEDGKSVKEVQKQAAEARRAAKESEKQEQQAVNAAKNAPSKANAPAIRTASDDIALRNEGDEIAELKRQLAEAQAKLKDEADRRSKDESRKTTSEKTAVIKIPHQKKFVYKQKKDTDGDGVSDTVRDTILETHSY